jgi:3D (Asp-Asp-Asp) domain-containing protein
LRLPANRGRQPARVRGVDEGLPIAYQVLDEGIPVYAADGVQVGTVDHVVAVPAQDIFHGIVLRVEGTRRFVAADQVASLHERGVDLHISATAAAGLPEPHGAAPAWRDREPGVKPSRWTHLVDLVSGKDPHRRDWTEDN